VQGEPWLNLLPCKHTALQSFSSPQINRSVLRRASPASSAPMSRELTAWVKDQARALGFGAVGIAPVEDPPQARAFADWIAGGCHGEMAYLARTATRRTNLSAEFPWARSIVSVALPYNTPHPRPVEPESGRGWISRHAWGDDYREVVRGKLAALLEAIRGKVGREMRGQAFSDSGPILERAIALRAGLGWVGKNTTILSTRLGSFFVLGELFLEIALCDDEPLAERCGQCRACLDACPTKALTAPYLLDARRCLSYLTIELRGAVPRGLRVPLGNHLFGCDICQDACPYNARARMTDETAFRPREGLHCPELEELLALSEAQFRERFQGSAILRSRRRGFLRNAAVALGNTGDAAAIPTLARLLEGESEPLIRGHAAWALGQIGGEAAKDALRRAAAREPDPAVREEIALACQDPR